MKLPMTLYENRGSSARSFGAYLPSRVVARRRLCDARTYTRTALVSQPASLKVLQELCNLTDQVALREDAHRRCAALGRLDGVHGKD